MRMRGRAVWQKRRATIFGVSVGAHSCGAVEALRQGFGEEDSFKVGRRTFTQQCEKYVGGLSEAGMSTRGSELLSIIFQDAGTDLVHATRLYCTIAYETKLHVSTGVVRTLS